MLNLAGIPEKLVSLDNAPGHLKLNGSGVVSRAVHIGEAFGASTIGENLGHSFERAVGSSGPPVEGAWETSMRFSFPNSARPKKAAKHIAKCLGLSLSAAQRGTACACGYRDWHELERSFGTKSPTTLDQQLSHEEFLDRQVNLALALAAEVRVPDGDAQYALSESRLTGDRPVCLDDQIAIRLDCWRRTVLPPVGRRQPGAVGKLKTAGRNGELAILRKYDRPTEVILQNGVGTVADFEYVSPRAQLPLFLPIRLYLPYGVWTESDGTRVLFSRDYCPMWRVLVDGKIERLEPWAWITFKKERHLWDDARTPWWSPTLRQALEAFLKELRIQALPIVADALPLLVHDPQQVSMYTVADLLKKHRQPTLSAA